MQAQNCEEIIADQLEDVMKRAGFLRDIGRKEQSPIERLIARLRDMLTKFREYFQKPQGKLTRAQADAWQMNSNARLFTERQTSPTAGDEPQRRRLRTGGNKIFISVRLCQGNVIK